MRAPVSVACAVLVSALPALAHERIGPSEVVDLDTVDSTCRAAPSDLAFLDCLDAAGLAPGAVAFAQALTQDPQIGAVGLLTGFTELGAVDLAQVTFPSLANTNHQTLFVNGTFGVLQPLALDLPAFPDHPATQSLLAKSPNAIRSGRFRVEGMRIVAPGHQRFILGDAVKDGCRACEVVADAVYWVDFQDGRLQGVRAMGAYPPGLLDPRARGAALIAGGALALHITLAMRGYDPGPFDAGIGPVTLSALHAFQTDHCLGSEPVGSARALATLASNPTPFSAPAPCPEP